MPSPAEQHRLKVETACHQGRAVSGETESIYQSRQLMEIRLRDDLRRLSEVRSRKIKNQIKVEIIPEYIDHITGLIIGAKAVQQNVHQRGYMASNQVLTIVCIWCFDVADYRRGMPMFEYALTFNLTSPEGFTRPMAEVVAEVIADNGLRDTDIKSGDSISALKTVIELTESRDMADEVRVKLYRAYGNANELIDPDTALKFYEKALSLSNRAGVKLAIRRIKKRRQKADE